MTGGVATGAVGKIVACSALIGSLVFSETATAGNLYSSTSVPTAPNSPNKSSEIEQLKSENELLKIRLEKLEAIVEEFTRH